MTTADNLEAKVDLGNGVKIVEHPCGIQFKFNPANGFEAINGLQSWGARLENFQFNDAASLKARVAQLNMFGENKVRAERTGEILEGYKEVFNADTAEHVAVLSKDYNLLQNRTLFETFNKVCEDTKLTPIGRIDVGKRGFTLGYSTFMNPEFTITLLEQYPEPIALGLEFRNSFAGQMGVDISVWGFQAYCRNFCQWGKLMGEVWIPHDSGAIAKVPELTEEYINMVLKDSPIITKTCSDAEGVHVDPKDVYDILVGTNLPFGICQDIATSPATYNKQLPVKDLSMFQLYACATNGITFRESTAYRSTLSYSEGALKLLTEKQEDLIEAGRKRLDAYADAKAKQNVKRNAIKAAIQVQQK